LNFIVTPSYTSLPHTVFLKMSHQSNNQRDNTPTFVFDEAAPDPNDNENDRAYREQWRLKYWKSKLGNESYLMTREVRQYLLLFKGYWPLFDAPEVLEFDDFKKFCYHAEIRDDKIFDFPEDFVPMEYYVDDFDNSEEWFKHCKTRKKEQSRVELFIKLDRKRFKEEKERWERDCEYTRSPYEPPYLKNGESSSDEESSDDEESSADEMIVSDKEDSSASKNIKGEEDCGSNKTEFGLDTMCLSELTDCVRSNIASYLTNRDWWEKVRRLNKKCIDWPKPPPEFEYTVILFCIVHVDEDHGYCGVAKTFADMLDAIRKSKAAIFGYDEDNPEYDEYDALGGRTGAISLMFLNFDPEREGKGDIPIAAYQNHIRTDSVKEILHLPRWNKLLNVKCPLRNDTMEACTYFSNEDQWIRLGKPRFLFKSFQPNDHGLTPQLFKSSLKPKVDIDLSKLKVIDTREYFDGHNHDYAPDTEVWYKFSEDPETYEMVAPDKSWVIFDLEMYNDTRYPY